MTDVTPVYRNGLSRRERALPCRLLLLALFVALFPSILPAQSPVSPDLGRHYLIPIPDTVENKNGGTRLTLQSRIELLLTAPSATAVRLSGPTGILLNRQIPAGGTEVVSVYDLYPPQVPIPLDPPGLRDPRLVEIRSDEAIFVTVRIVNPFGSETFRPLPVEVWGSAYHLASLRNWFVQSIGVDPGTSEEGFEVLDVYPWTIVIAAEDSTRVTLDPRLPTPGPFTFLLDAGEAYSIPINRRVGALDTAARDLSGMAVTADRPIGILSGNTRSPAAAPRTDLTVLPGNGLQNLLAEWLPSASRPGRRFLYTPVNTYVDGAPELIRIIPLDPGTTIVQTSDGRSASRNQGDWMEFVVAPGAEPFTIDANGDVLAILVTGARGVYTPNNEAGQGYGWLETWSPAMTLLEPVESWGNVAWAYGYGQPASLEQAIVVVAEEGTLLVCNGRPVRLDPVAGTGFVTGRVEIGAGEQYLRSIGGRFSAIGYGIRPGFEAFLVPGVDDGGDGKERRAAHVTEYVEHLSLAWATPVPSAVIADPLADSVVVTTEEFCDSTVITVRRRSDRPEREGPLAVEFAEGVNTRVSIDTLAPDGPVVGYRLLLEPLSRTEQSRGRVIVRGVGLQDSVDYLFTPESLLLPEVIDFGVGITPGSTVVRTETIENLRSFPVTILEVRVLTVPGPFAARVEPPPARRIDVGGRLAIDITFSGDIRSYSYVDTLLIRTDCGEYRIPLRAGTSDEVVEDPLPTITGYDWRTRPIGSTGDTLSFIANSGGLPYTITDVRIRSGAATPFTLIPPFHRSNRVSGEDTVRVGIRFAPVIPGEWTDTILLVTTDGDSARALLHGIAVDTATRFAFEVDPVDLDTICIGDTLLVGVTLRNSGSVPVPVEEVDVVRATGAEYLDVSWPEGMTIPVGGSIRIVLRIIATAPGPVELLLGVNPEGVAEGEILRIVGIAKVCAPPDLVVTDHDFGEIWITTSRPGSVRVKNVGRGPVTVEDAVILNDPEGSFLRTDPPVPFTLAEGDSLDVFLRFTPMTEGEKRGEILFTTSVGERTSQLRGRGKRLVVPAFIRRDYRAAPGTEVEIAVEIEEPSDTVFPDRLDYTVRFSDELLDALGVVDSAGVEVPRIGFGEVGGVVRRDPGDSLHEGTLLRLRFLVRLSLLRETELPFEIISPLPWLEFEERPGLFVREEICALETRLFDFTRFGVEIGSPEPNPSSLEATFTFEIPFDGLTTVVIYDLLGTEVLRLLDATITAGRYQLSIPSDRLSPGTYMLRFRSGTFDATRRVDVVR